MRSDILPSERWSWDALPAGLLGLVAGFCAEEELLAGHDRILVACSGGADSLALLAILDHPRFAAAAGLAHGPELVVGHVDHGLRPGSAEDAAAVARLAEGLGLPCVAESLSWPRHEGVVEPDRPDTSEAESRRARLAALERLAEDVGAGAIALGHTASDQLETLLMRLHRGSGLRGLAGMAPRRAPYVRPLLPVTRAQTQALVAALGWQPREDPTNDSDAFLRNRVRHHLVPLIEAENPRAAQAAFRAALTLRDELAVLESLEAATWEKLGSLAPGGPSVPSEALRELPAGLAGRILRRMWRLVADEPRHGESAAQPGELGREHVIRVLGLLGRGEGTSRVDLPGDVVALRIYDRLIFCPRRRLDDPGDVELPVPGPGLYDLEALGLTIEVSDTGLENAASQGESLVEAAAGSGAVPGRSLLVDEAFVDCPGDAGSWSLRVRNPRPGDRVDMGVGHKKVSDLMVDAKVPQPDRRRTPMLVEGEEILWIPGVFRSRRALAHSDPGSSGSRGPSGEGEASSTSVRLVFRWGAPGRPGR